MKLIRYSRFRNLCLQRAPFKRWPSATRNRDFDNVIKEMKGIFKVGERTLLPVAMLRSFGLGT
jgi:hypothetical protein